MCRCRLQKAEHVRKTNRIVFLVVVGALLLLLYHSFWWPLAFLVAVSALVYRSSINEGFETWKHGWEGGDAFSRDPQEPHLSDSWTAWYGVPVGRNKDGEIIRSHQD